MDRWITVGDMEVRVLGEGPPIVLCHGFTTTGAFWKEQESFSRANRLVVLNLPGHGPSARPMDRKYSMDAFVADVALVFSKLELQGAVFVGLSMGGTIAQRFVLQHPRQAAALVLVGATPNGLGPDVQVNNVLSAIEELGVQSASQRVIERSFGPLARKELIAFAKEEVSHTPDYVAREAIKSLNESDTRSELRRIAVPTLVVCGSNDRITPAEQSRELASGIPDARLVILQGAGHFPMLEAPEEFNAELSKFLTQSGLSERLGPESDLVDALQAKRAS